MQRRSPAPVLAAALAALSLSFLACPNPAAGGPSDPEKPPVVSGSADDADLASLSLEGVDCGWLSPVPEDPELGPKAVFGAAVRHYAIVKADVDSVTVKAAAVASGATVAGAGVHALGAAGTVTEIKVSVTSRSGRATTEHVLSVRRAALDATGAAELTKAWMVIESVSGLPMKDAKVARMPSLGYPLAKDPVSGKYRLMKSFPLPTGATVSFSGASDDPAAVVADSGKHVLAAGKNEFALKLVALDGSVKSYGIEIEAKDKPDPSAMDLSNLLVKNAELSPAFDPEIHTYSCVLPSDAASLDFHVARKVAGSEPSYTLADSEGMKQYQSGTAVNGTFSVSGIPFGLSVLTIAVREDRSTSQYFVYLFRPDPAGGKSADLFDLKFYAVGDAVSPLELKPAFDPGVLSYTLEIPSYVRFVNQVARTEDGKAFLEYRFGDAVSFSLGVIDFESGKKTLGYTVRAADGSKTKTYTVEATRRAAPTFGAVEKRLSADGKTLVLSGTLNDGAGEVAAVEMEYGKTTQAVLSGSSFSVEVDLSVLPAGKGVYMLLGYHAPKTAPLATSIVEIDNRYSGAPAGKSIETLVRNGVPFEGTKYLFLMAAAYDQVSDETNFVRATVPVPVTAADFPLVASIPGLPAGSYFVQGALYDSPTPSNARPFLMGTVGAEDRRREPIVLSDADLTGYVMTLGFTGRM